MEISYFTDASWDSEEFALKVRVCPSDWDTYQKNRSVYIMARN